MNKYQYNKQDVAFLSENVRFARNLSDFDGGSDMSESEAAAVAPTIRFVKVKTQQTPIGISFAATVVGTSSVPSVATGRLRAIPVDHPVRLRRPSHRGCGCAELPLMVQAPPSSGFLIPLGPSHCSVAPPATWRSSGSFSGKPFEGSRLHSLMV